MGQDPGIAGQIPSTSDHVSSTADYISSMVKYLTSMLHCVTRMVVYFHSKAIHIPSTMKCEDYNEDMVNKSRNRRSYCTNVLYQVLLLSQTKVERTLVTSS